MLFHIQGLFEQIDAMTKAATGNFQGDYFCGSGIGFDDGQAMPMDASTPGTNDGKDGGMPVICKTQSLFAVKFTLATDAKSCSTIANGPTFPEKITSLKSQKQLRR